MADFLHGVETIQLAKGPTPIRVVKSATIFLVGTAPIQDVDAANRTINEPVLILNREDAVKHFGEKKQGYTIPYALDAIFDHGGTVCVVVNVFDPDKHKDASGNPDPSQVKDGDIIGSVDPTTGKRTGLQIVEELYSRFGFTAKILLAPVYSQSAAVMSEMIAKANLKSVRGVALIDAPIGYTVQDAITARGAGGLLNTSDYRAIICYPHVKEYDEIANTEIVAPLSNRLAGVIAETDHNHGYWWSPSNKEIKGIIGVERHLTASINDPLCEVNQLNANGILTVFNSFGTGYRVWGNRNAAFPSKTDPLTFISVQRTADIIAESIEYFTMQYLDKPITVAIDGVLSSVNAFIRTLIGRGALVDGKCYFLKDKNPPDQLAAGHLTFTYEIMPPTPAERITFEEVINTELLKKLAA